jgi:hypothetical protein
MTFSQLVLPNPDINAVPVRTPHHVSNQLFRSGRHHAPAQSHASSTLAGTAARAAFWPAQFDLGWQGEHVLVGVHRHRFLPKVREALLEVSDVSREFPLVSVLKFFMSGQQVDTLRYKIGCRLPRRLGTVACMENSDHILVVDDDLGLREPATAIG